MKHPDFAQRFQEAVASAGVPDSQDELGRLLGVSGVMIWSYRNGEKLPRMATALRIAEKLGVSVNWLLMGEGPMKPDSSGEPPQRTRTAMRPVPIISWQRAMAGNLAHLSEKDYIGESYALASEATRLIALVAETDEMDGFRGPTRIQKGSHLIIAPDTAQLPLEELTGKVVAAYKDDGSYCFRQLERQGGQFVLTAWSDRAWLPVIPLSEGWKIIGQVINTMHFAPLIDL